MDGGARGALEGRMNSEQSQPSPTAYDAERAQQQGQVRAQGSLADQPGQSGSYGWLKLLLAGGAGFALAWWLFYGRHHGLSVPSVRILKPRPRADGSSAAERALPAAPAPETPRSLTGLPPPPSASRVPPWPRRG
jgi:hypothetical protein